MGTRSVVAVRERDSVEILSAYVHYDGYLSGVGVTLLSEFNSAEGARKVVEGGYYSSLSENLEESLSKSANKEEPSVYKNMEEFKHDCTHSDWEFAYLYDVEKDAWLYAKMTGWGESSEGFENYWSEFEVMADDVLKDALETASRLEHSKWNGDYDDYVVELREWATGFIADTSVK